ncbi:hypothetical protein [Nostoc sp.]|uniref:hypothetical protein n=1 Tax=Nostoc sp. TaxID=1180 RepID=UPI002FF53237
MESLIYYLPWRLEVARQVLMGSHCGGRVPRHKASGVETPYSPSLTGRLTANGHPTAGASLSFWEKTALAWLHETLPTYPAGSPTGYVG